MRAPSQQGPPCEGWGQAYGADERRDAEAHDEEGDDDALLVNLLLLLLASRLDDLGRLQERVAEVGGGGGDRGLRSRGGLRARPVGSRAVVVALNRHC